MPRSLSALVGNALSRNLPTLDSFFATNRPKALDLLLLAAFYRDRTVAGSRALGVLPVNTAVVLAIFSRFTKSQSVAAFLRDSRTQPCDTARPRLRCS